MPLIILMTLRAKDTGDRIYHYANCALNVLAKKSKVIQAQSLTRALSDLGRYIYCFPTKANDRTVPPTLWPFFFSPCT